MERTLIIERLHVEGFWDKYTLDIPFHTDVSIITGNNGAGKTTVLDIICYIITNGSEAKYVRSRFSSVKLLFSNNSAISVESSSTGEDRWQYTLDGHEVDFQTIKEFLSAISVSSFDTQLPPIEYINKVRSDKPSVKSDMDVELNMWFKAYYQYMASVSRQVEQLLKIGISSEEIQPLYSYSQLMEELCNELFDKKKIWHMADDGDIEFLLPEFENKVIKPEELSSGEKQILVLLISTLIQGGKPYIALWDEPEISLHISWQQKLIRILRSLNPNMQLIIATHAPNILYEGWEGQVIKMNRVLNNKLEQSHDRNR